MAWGGSGNGELDVGSAESGLSVLLEACERAVEEVGVAVPPVQLRALLVIDRAGSLNLSRLAGLLGASASAASRLCDRMQALARGLGSWLMRATPGSPAASGRRARRGGFVIVSLSFGGAGLCAGPARESLSSWKHLR